MNCVLIFEATPGAFGIVKNVASMKKGFGTKPILQGKLGEMLDARGGTSFPNPRPVIQGRRDCRLKGKSVDRSAAKKAIGCKTPRDDILLIFMPLEGYPINQVLHSVRKIE
ncbi:hypothetical protein LOK49_LG02G00284 [Camellia lanceoleosa]|uniref:Uncharacterized protein n=1 Tax=Camellia lanceoleosa TaxID=1840588 RepID=A0ACC0IJF7_9ERIC|nr:hypothetical protein LOK49_LG02G00284 [Camellia lanceoleosa]